MRKGITTLLFLLVALTVVNAQVTQNATHLVPTGKGWGVESQDNGTDSLPQVITGKFCGKFNYHGGPVIHGQQNIFHLVRELDQWQPFLGQPDNREPAGRTFQQHRTERFAVLPDQHYLRRQQR